ncbi:MAG: hypothetical protein DHS20C18_32400 [Saprospiraceae bacterium]|nr:MAG: hypothetical protein DHS20C18_32400 [Saprospiraceae bacterium]
MGLKEVVQAIGDGVISNETTQTNAITYLIWHIRLPRIILALLVGAGLATSGAAIQGLFRNPLADPALIGITSGAMVFAVAGILFAGVLLQSLNGFLGYATITFLAFSGSFLSTIIVYRLATVEGHTSVSTLLLAGIAITALGGAITGLMTYYSSEDELRDITFWTLGSLGGANWKMLAFVCPLVIGSIFILLKNATRLDILLLGEKEARYLGVHTQKLKWIIVGCTAMAVGVCVAVSGVIAFVALVIPHLIRLCKGTGHYNLLTGSALLGGILLVWADNFARTAIAPAELPIGILTALLGAPFFIWLLLKSRQNFS